MPHPARASLLRKPWKACSPCHPRSCVRGCRNPAGWVDWLRAVSPRSVRCKALVCHPGGGRAFLSCWPEVGPAFRSSHVLYSPRRRRRQGRYPDLHRGTPAQRALGLHQITELVRAQGPGLPVPSQLAPAAGLGTREPVSLDVVLAWALHWNPLGNRFSTH